MGAAQGQTLSQGLNPKRALAEGAAAPAGGSTTQNTVLALAGAASNAWNRLSRVPGAGAHADPLTLEVKSQLHVIETPQPALAALAAVPAAPAMPGG